MTNIQPSMEKLERPDPILTNKIVTHLKSQGIFDQFRKECMADVDTKPAYHNLRQRVEGSVAAFLKMNPWKPDMNKNQIRDNLRKHIQSGGFLDIGVDRIVDQVVNPKIYTVFLPKVEEVVQSCLAMENDKPKFEPPPTEVKSLPFKSEPPKFQDKHNLAPRAKLPAPLMGPAIKPIRPTEQAEGRSSPVEQKPLNNGEGDAETEEAGDKKYVVDEDDPEEKEEEDDDDDEESPPFEPHSEGDRMILGMRSDTSENSNDSQVVTTTIVDDSLEEKIDNNETGIKEECDKKDEDSSSDEYVPKTPTINMEESDDTVVEFNSISEYKQYHTKFEEESFGNVEEVVESQSLIDNTKPKKEERSSNEDESVSGPQKRKFDESYEEVSSSGSDRESTSDEIKPAVFESFSKKRFKLDEYDNETSEFSVNEDSCTEKSLDMSDSKFKILETGHQEKYKSNSAGSKDSGKHSHEHKKEHRDSSNHHSSKNKTLEMDQHEKHRSSHHNSRDKKHKDKKNEMNESSKDDNKQRERKKSESSNKTHEKDKDKQSKHYDKEKEKDREKKSKSSDRSKKDKEDISRVQKESKQIQKDHQQDHKSRSDRKKDRKKHSSRDNYSDGKRESDHKNRKDDSKHIHSSGSHSHSQSSEKPLLDKNHKHRESGDKHRSGDKKNGKEESKQKYRQHCKYDNKHENRRSSDRDSSGPSESTHSSSNLKSRSSRCHKESKDESGERTTSNSDDTVSDNVETLQDDMKIDVMHECGGITSPDTKSEKETSHESDLMTYDLNCSNTELHKQNSECKSLPVDNSNKEQGGNFKNNVIFEDDKEIYDASTSQIQNIIPEINNVPQLCLAERSTDTEFKVEKQDSTNSSVSLMDSSSEKENVEQDSKELNNSEFDGNSTDASLDEESTVVKFKKPKIAQNIHEVKKIMEARRHLKRMEKKRIKLLSKSNSEEYESDEKSPVENTSDETQNAIFRGFENNFSLDKIETYKCLTKRLESEISQLEKLTNHEQVNSNLITSWVDLDPDLDVYIENTLQGKVHRIYRVQLPPICEEFYDYNSEQNFYVLVKNWDSCDQINRMVDSNLNNLNSMHPTTQQENINSYRVNSRKGKLEYGSVANIKEEISTKDGVHPKQNFLKLKINCKNTQSDDEVITPDETNASNNSGKKTTDVIAPQTNFSLTFNQTYDEVLKEKAQNSVVPPKKEIDEMNKTPLTVVKITKNKTSEQVFLKKIQSNSEEKNQVPRITRSDSVINGKVFELPDSKQIPLISRITKQKNIMNIASAKITYQETNGVMSSNSRRNFEEELQNGVNQKIINEVIGIHNVSSDQGNISDHRNQTGEEVIEQKRKRATGCRQQRYDSSDLYKPRPQLSSRRERNVGSSPEEPSTIAVAARRKRSATSSPNSSPSKRRR